MTPEQEKLIGQTGYVAADISKAIRHEGEGPNPCVWVKARVLNVTQDEDGDVLLVDVDGEQYLIEAREVEDLSNIS